MRVSKYANENTASGTAAKPGSMVDADIAQLDSQVTAAIADCDGFTAAAVSLDLAANADDATVATGTVTTAQAQASVQLSDDIMGNLKKLLADPVTQESATADPMAALMATSKDKRGMGAKALDFARKAFTTAEAAIRKLIAKLLTYFNKFETTLKDLSKELSDMSNFDTKQSYEQDDKDTLGELIRPWSALGENTNTIVQWAGAVSKYTLGMDVTSEFKAKVASNDVDLPNAMADDAEYEALYAGIYADGIVVQIVATEKDGSESSTSYYTVNVEAPEYNDGTDTIQGFQKKTLEDIIKGGQTVGKSFGKTIDKEFKVVKEAGKEFDAVAKKMKSDPSQSAKNEYNAALSKLKASPKIAHVKSMTMYTQVKVGIKIARLLIDGQENKSKSNN